MKTSLLFSVCTAVLGLHFADAAGVGSDFAVVIDNGDGAFGGFGAHPSINNSGVVAFHGEQGSAAPGTYKRSGPNAPVFIADDSSGVPSIDNAGAVVSRRLVGANTQQIFKGDGATALRTVAETGAADGTFRIFFGLPQLADDSGQAVFYAELYPYNPRRRGLYVGDGNGNPGLVADNTGAFAYFGDTPSINNSGTVAFVGTLVSTESGLFVGQVGGNGLATAVLTDASSGFYRFDGSPSINNSGTIAGKAYETATGMPAIFAIDQNSANLRTVATASGAFSQFQPPVINDAGTIVFYAFTDAGGRGIYAGADPVADKVIEVGDTLFGETVTNLAFFRGLNDLNELVFYFALADGREGIARAKVAARNARALRVTNLSRLTNGHSVLIGEGPAGWTVYIQSASNPAIGFENVDSVVIGTDGTFTWEDRSTGSPGVNFYRVVHP